MKFLPLADRTEMAETELIACACKSYGLTTVRYPLLEITATIEPFDSCRPVAIRPCVPEHNGERFTPMLDLAMLKVATAALVFSGGFAVMVLEIIGVRYLAKDFGGSFYVWVSQIGVILVALALGYAIGGALADRFRRVSFLAAPLALAGLFTALIPDITPPLINAIILRHPAGKEIPMVWQKLDPAMGSAVVFFLPCLVLAVLSPYMIRVTARQLEHVGTVSGLIYAASTIGSIAGVFVAGYIFIDYLTVTTIFRSVGTLTIGLAGLSLAIDRWLGGARP